ncbi:hypothetical protein JTE90_016149 [Oedothorax gibbosus]|uniref:Uncharacterized protein n=1 Tax=Oedothorax gibbosus TaxID=931172 RepID=A0AAV6TE75_9ARAC|nr:hypothetical protein JTE90_016149 [Oedothorax gibbosus]
MTPLSRNSSLAEKFQSPIPRTKEVQGVYPFLRKGKAHDDSFNWHACGPGASKGITDPLLLCPVGKRPSP